MSEHLRVIGNQLLGPDGTSYRCAVGKGGFVHNKHEGDGCTPIGIFALRECWFRPDHLKTPKTGLLLHPIQENDGWCDDPKSPDYNRPVQYPYPFSHERLWRNDSLYDLIIPMGYNDNPVIAGKGSAIFLHIAKPDYAGTEGCIALALEDLLALLPQLTAQSHIELRPE